MIKTNIKKLAVLFCGLLISQNAFAHSPIKGIGFLFNGMLHPFLIPAHVLVIVTLGFWLGQLQPKKHRASILLYLLAMVVGFTLSAFNLSLEYFTSTYFYLNNIGTTLLLVIAMLIGFVSLSAISVPVFVTSIVCFIVALLLGLDSQLEDLTGSVKNISLVGNAVGSYMILLYAIALSETMSIKNWQKVAIKILTSWLSASAFMVLALNVSTN